MAERLSAEDVRIVGECLHAAVAGPFFEDWEFRTLIGVDRARVAALAAAWPSSTGDPDEAIVVNNVLANLLGYPHGLESRWPEYCSAPLDAVPAVLARLRRTYGLTP